MNYEKLDRLSQSVCSYHVPLRFLKILVDYDHYLSQQIFPPVERLCDPIEGTDRARLAECLGGYLFYCHL